MALTSTLEDIEFLSLIETMGVFYGAFLLSAFLCQNQGSSSGVLPKAGVFEHVLWFFAFRIRNHTKRIFYRMIDTIVGDIWRY